VGSTVKACVGMLERPYGGKQVESYHFVSAWVISFVKYLSMEWTVYSNKLSSSLEILAVTDVFVVYVLLVSKA